MSPKFSNDFDILGVSKTIVRQDAARSIIKHVPTEAEAALWQGGSTAMHQVSSTPSELASLTAFADPFVYSATDGIDKAPYISFADAAWATPASGGFDGLMQPDITLPIDATQTHVIAADSDFHEVVAHGQVNRIWITDFVRLYVSLESSISDGFA